MSAHVPSDPNWQTRLADSFDRQRIMAVMGITLAEAAPGRVVLGMPFHPDFTQQHGFLHAGAVTAATDSACGYAAFTLMPAGAEVLTVEFKVNLLSPARGERFRFEGAVIKPGRTLMVAEGRAFAVSGGAEKLIATMTATLMSLTGRADLAPGAEPPAAG